MSMKRILLSISAITVVMVGVQLSQLSKLDSQYRQVKQELVKAKRTQGKVKEIVASPVAHKTDVKKATQTVTDFMNIVTTHSVNDYPDVLKDKATLKVINTLSQELAPSVTFGGNQKFNLVTVSINRVFDNHLQYAIVEKSETQSVVYTLTFDIDVQRVTDIQRLSLKGTYYNEK